MKDKILIVTLKTWNIKNFYKLKHKYPNFSFKLITQKEDLSPENLAKMKPKLIFFPHYSYKIPKQIYENYTCILFHMSDLPYGRGGSPLQNLISLGVYHTKISALKVSEELDGGDIYMKENFDISKGRAKKLYKRASKIIFFKMIPFLMQNKLKPKAQSGKALLFKRRSEEQSDILSLKNCDLRKIYDFIRMLDAPSYPKAFLEFEDFKMTLKKAKFKGKFVKGEFKIERK